MSLYLLWWYRRRVETAAHLGEQEVEVEEVLPEQLRMAPVVRVAVEDETEQRDCCSQGHS